MRFTSLVFLVLPALAGCASVRSDFVAANGEKLSVYDKAFARSGHNRVQTGVDEIRGSNGELLGTNTRYEDKEVHWTAHDWYGMQGGVRVDDESFFRIAGDEDATSTYKAHHEEGATKIKLGEVFTAVGLTLLAAGVAGFVLDKPRTDPVTHDTTTGGIRKAGEWSMALGGFSTAGGIAFLFDGVPKAHATDARLVNDPDRASADAERYNEKLALAAQQRDSPTPTAKPAAPPPDASAAVDPEEFSRQLPADAPADCRTYIVQACGKAHGSKEEREGECKSYLSIARKTAKKHPPVRPCAELLGGLAK